MRPIPIAKTLLTAIALLAACADGTSPTTGYDAPLFATAPADGNGNKLVIPIDFNLPEPVICEGGAMLSVHVGGWLQIRVTDQPHNRNAQLNTVQILLTYANAAAAEFVWHETGNDQFYIDENGDLIHVLTGRAGGFGVIGRLVIVEETGEVQFVAGNPTFADDLACAALG